NPNELDPDIESVFVPEPTLKVNVTLSDPPPGMGSSSIGITALELTPPNVAPVSLTLLAVVLLVLRMTNLTTVLPLLRLTETISMTSGDTTRTVRGLVAVLPALSVAV